MNTKRPSPLQFAEAFGPRIDRIRMEWAKDPKADRKPDIDLLATVLGQIEKTLGIEYDTNSHVSHTSRPTCSLCGRSYGRVNDLDDHIKSKHKYLQPIVESVTCYYCHTLFNSHKKLVFHEKKVHQAVYQSRLDFVWPGFAQPDPEELQNSFLGFLQGDGKKQKIDSPLRVEASASSSPTTPFLGRASNSNPTPQIDQGQCANPPVHLQFDESNWYNAHSFLPTDVDGFNIDNLQFPSSHPAFFTLTGGDDEAGHDSFLLGGTGS